MIYQNMLLSFVLMVLVYTLHGVASKAVRPPVNCTNLMTCAECTSRETCGWSMQRQECGTWPEGNMTVTACPVLRATYDQGVYRVTVANDHDGLLDYLHHVGIKCWRGRSGPSVGHVLHRGHVTNSGKGEIVCDRHSLLPAVTKSNSSIIVGSFYITFGSHDVMLRTEDRTYFYTSHLYDRDCNFNRRHTDVCIACTVSNEGERRVYVQKCVKKTAEVLRCIDWMFDENDPEANSRNRLLALCVRQPKKTVSSFSPQTAPWDADATTITVNVNGHMTFARNGLERVTVAGHECVDPTTVSENQFTCTVYGPLTRAQSGTVRVEYGPDHRLIPMFDNPNYPAVFSVRNAIESDVPFRFVERAQVVQCVPRPVAGQTYAGIASGGSTSLVHWTGLDCVDGKAPIKWYAEGAGDGYRYSSTCSIADLDLWITLCTAPSVALFVDTLSVDATDRDGPIARFRCGFELRLVDGQTVHVPCGPSGSSYYAFADPVFQEFDVTDNGTIAIYGRHVGPTFRPDDVGVLIHGYDAAGGELPWCVVRSLASDLVECSPDDPAVYEFALKNLQEVSIQVGTMKAVSVKRRLQFTSAN